MVPISWNNRQLNYTHIVKNVTVAYGLTYKKREAIFWYHFTGFFKYPAPPLLLAAQNVNKKGGKWGKYMLIKHINKSKRCN